MGVRGFAAWVVVVFSAVAGPVSAQTAAPAGAGCPPLLQQTYPRLQDEKPQNLCQYSGQVLVVVNTASYCGFTPQYKDLEALYDRYRSQGLVVLGFPSNDFNQEKGSNKEIADFCENTFGVKFPMFAASSVKGPKASPLYRQLAQATGRVPDWNFNKYLIDRSGRPVGAFASGVQPLGKDFVAQVEQLLKQKAP